MNSILLVVTSDAEYQSQFEAIAGEYLIDCHFASFGEHLSDLVKRMNPFLLVVDFSIDNQNWIIKHLSEIKGSRPAFPIIGIISGDSEAEELRMQKIGCDHVFPRERFLKKAGGLIERYLR